MEHVRTESSAQWNTRLAQPPVGPGLIALTQVVKIQMNMNLIPALKSLPDIRPLARNAEHKANAIAI